MKAITIRQPWANAIVYGSKRIENRHRADGREPKVWTKFLGQRLAIHAAGKVHPPDMKDAQLFCDDRGLVIPRHDLIVSAILGTAMVAGVVYPDELITWMDGFPGQWVDLRWHTGGYGIVFSDVVPLQKPFRCTGFQGPWDAPVEAINAV